MIRANFEIVPYRWYLWLLCPIQGALAFVVGGAAVFGHPELPFSFFIAGVVVLQQLMPLGRVHLAYPVSRAGWFWSRVHTAALAVVGILVFWFLGLGGTVVWTGLRCPEVASPLWAFALFTATLLGPYIAIVLGASARSTVGLAAVQIVLMLTPWGSLGTMVTGLSPVNQGWFGAVLVSLVAGSWTVTLNRLRSLDWGKKS